MNTVTITLSQDEITALAGLLDAAVKATGIQGAKAAVPLRPKVKTEWRPRPARRVSPQA